MVSSEMGIWEIEDPIQLHAERRRAEVAQSLIQPDYNDVILDLGCGDAYQISYLIKYKPHIIGIDTSLSKLKKGKRKVGKAHFICASSEKLPFQPEVFNKAMCLELLEHLKDPSKTIKEINFVLKKEGILIVSVPYRKKISMTQCIHCGKLTPHYGHLHSFDEEKLASLLSKNYTVIHQERICTVAACYPVFQPISTRLWKIIDNVCRSIPGMKPSWLIDKVQKS